jgi:hypothetical protein
MCGRYYIGPEAGEKLQFQPGEVFPGQRAPVILRGDAGESIARMKWGFPRIGGGGLVINSRSEKADVTNMFRRAVRERRCLVPMTGFYEWRRSPSGAKSKEKFVQDTFKAMFKRIDSAPAADVAPVVHGRWLYKRLVVFDYIKDLYRCSECNTIWDAESNYCPNCAAKMDLKGGEG